MANIFFAFSDEDLNLGSIEKILMGIYFGCHVLEFSELSIFVGDPGPGSVRTRIRNVLLLPGSSTTALRAMSSRRLLVQLNIRQL